MRLLRLPELPDSAVEIAAELAALAEPERRSARVRQRQEAANLRRRMKRAQAAIRLADTFAKLGGGSLLTASLLLLVNGQVTRPVIGTALLALLVFLASTIYLMLLDRIVAEYEHAVDVIEAALKETER